MVVDVESSVETSGMLARETIKQDSDHEYGIRRSVCATGIWWFASRRS